MALVPRPQERAELEPVEPYPIAGRFGPCGTVLIDPPRLASSPWRDKLDASAKRRDCAVYWRLHATPGIQSLFVEVRDSDGWLLRDSGLTKRADRVDYAAVAERVAERLMTPA